MIGWLVDTNVISALAAVNGAPSVKAWGRSVDEGGLYLSILTLAEYDKGIANLAPNDPGRVKHAATRDAIAERFEGRILPLSNQVVRRWGVISGIVRRETGHPPPVIDTMLAAAALEANLYLVTRNVRDVQHSGARIFNPWADDSANFPIQTLKRIKPEKTEAERL